MSREPPESPARAAVARLPPRPRFLQLVPSGRSVAVSLLVVVIAGLAYVGARETPVFAVRTIDVEGERPAVARRVAIALRPLEGRSLLKLRADDVTRHRQEAPGESTIGADGTGS